MSVGKNCFEKNYTFLQSFQYLYCIYENIVIFVYTKTIIQ